MPRDLEEEWYHQGRHLRLVDKLLDNHRDRRQSRRRKRILQRMNPEYFITEETELMQKIFL